MTNEFFEADRFLFERVHFSEDLLCHVWRSVAAKGLETPADAGGRAVFNGLGYDVALALGRDGEGPELLRIVRAKRSRLRGRYEVLVGRQRVGRIERKFPPSPLRSTWRIVDGEERRLLAVAKERSFLGGLTRAANLLLARLGLYAYLPYAFAIVASGRPLGYIRREASIRTRYELDLSADARRSLDRRLGVALALMVDLTRRRDARTPN